MELVAFAIGVVIIFLLRNKHLLSTYYLLVTVLRKVTWYSDNMTLLGRARTKIRTQAV